uniref:t-SNARE coiled-coil homology domain-containing protein n=2 Tax=Steinernema glaseri TaxID=37863 RepID=A0A1I7ZB31_9BILA
MLKSSCGNGFGGNEQHGFMEEQNNAMADQLSNKVSALKRITIAIGDDVREQNRLLGEMETSFDSSKGLLGSTMRKLTSVYRAGGWFL